MNKLMIDPAKINQQGNYIYMLVGLLGLIIGGPVLSEYFEEGSRIFIQLTFTAIMFIGVWTLFIDQFWFKVGISFACISLILSVANYYVVSDFVFIAGLVASFLFLLLSIILAISHIIFSGKVTFNKIIGSLCIYLLIGVIWAVLYIIIAVISFGTFEDIIHSTHQINAWDNLYFSFVTLTTLGYGDITPSISIVRSLAYIEAIFGQFYLTILVASLVGAYIKDHD